MIKEKSRRRRHCHEWWMVAVLSAIIWWAMLIALLACWAAQGHPSYAFLHRPEQHIMYISDIAATNLQPIFISLAAVQGLLFVIALGAERYLRHSGRLRRNYRRREKWLAGIGIFCAIISQLGILFVSIFNTHSFHKAHESMVGVFICFLGVSALTYIAEYYYLDKNYPEYLSILYSMWFKVLWFLIELALAIAFVTAHGDNRRAVVEWVLSFIYPFFTLDIAWDLLPARNKEKGHYNDYTRYGPHSPTFQAYGNEGIREKVQRGPLRVLPFVRSDRYVNRCEETFEDMRPTISPAYSSSNQQWAAENARVDKLYSVLVDPESKKVVVPRSI